MIHPENRFMEAAIGAALRSKQLGDYAVGAVVVQGEWIISTAGNRTRLDQLATAHAEKLAIEKASRLLEKRHLTDCVLYSTHEPCPLCIGASYFAKLQGVVYGAGIEDMREFAVQNRNHQWVWRTINMPAIKILESADSPTPLVVGGFMREECLKLFHS